MKIGGMQHRDDESFLSKLQDGTISGCGDQRTFSHLLRRSGANKQPSPSIPRLNFFIPLSFRSNLWRL